ncbi:Chloroplast stem-loop binding protein b, chloroplastic [Beauveria bassiana]|uniref:NAD-dependent epimerase/dehydratase n=1 Tax=Beauveria bassiana (strain ARSEF 2860) TaxID=655819 RepID=J4ULL5_BEAB2|nr:NAD-dependent epimerase/dehydratase [Beauveria bassiana ARSEF 2860]EJP65472.1 NAD-dependent epimerase/dehydratase [Beauveria bassiana ARSEF 2860]KAF1732904.1 Chloroplast stem-loop binding protein b, chloroplastic [Beauveria bassiana]KAH8713052.1 Chloroplast stem-loop binding protein b, chloroplastic [Beauveria bassiana]
MHFLILGGTHYIGRLVAEQSLARGHQVTVFNRGSKPAPTGAQALVGDRLAPDGYAALSGLFFDAVIDTWAGDASAVKRAVAALRDRTRHYAFVSSISVYDHAASPGPYDETSALRDIDKTPVAYFRDKLGSEREAAASGVPTLIVRPGLIVGPGETTPGRLPWWLRRMERGDATMAPGPRDLALQFIDGRDLAAFLVDGAERRLEGAFDAVSGIGHITMEGLLEAANEAAGGRASLHWVDGDKVAEAVLGKHMEIPMWFPKEHAAIFQSTGKKAAEAELQIRPATETIQDTWDWVVASGWKIGDGPAGVPEDVEADILKQHAELSRDRTGDQ